MKYLARWLLLAPDLDERPVYLPAGDWLDIDGTAVPSGDHVAPVRADAIPAFTRSGSAMADLFT